MRLFFAVTLPDELVEKVLEAQAALRELVGDEGVRWTKPEQFHYTLKFLSEQSAARAERAVECAEAARESHAGFAMTLGGLGAFPSDQRPSTLWLGATAGADTLAAIAADLDTRLTGHGFPRENKPLKAHLTLGRIKTYKGEAAAARALRKMAEDPRWSGLGSFRVDRFVLMRSTLKPEGSEYAVVDEFHLNT
jgi:RNA 2',3'-cyclic 3'-phosphodiesterase